MQVKVECTKCGELQTVEMSDEEFDNLRKYHKGEGHIQDLLPRLTASERELFISGICGKCWIELFGEEQSTVASKHVDINVTK